MEINNLLQQKVGDLEGKICKLNKSIKRVENDMYDRDCRVIQNLQYSRLENVVITGIPHEIQQDRLEETVLRIMKTIGLEGYTSYDIATCHRLGKKKK